MPHDVSSSQSVDAGGRFRAAHPRSGRASARCSIFFFNDTATTEIYTLSLHDALPISKHTHTLKFGYFWARYANVQTEGDRKSTRLNSSHSQISYAVFCLKKKKT